MGHTTLVNGALIALDRRTGKTVYTRRLPTSTDSPIAIAGDTVLVLAGGVTGMAQSRDPQVVAYTVR